MYITKPASSNKYSYRHEDFALRCLVPSMPPFTGSLLFHEIQIRENDHSKFKEEEIC